MSSSSPTHSSWITTCRQAFLLGVLAALLAMLTAIFHPKRPSWSDSIPGEESLPTVLSWGKNVLWVDARPTAEFNAGHFPGAVALNLENWDQLFPEFLDRWKPDQKVVVYCGSQSCDLSRQVAERLRKNGINPVFDLKGGWESLKNAKPGP